MYFKEIFKMINKRIEVKISPIIFADIILISKTLYKKNNEMEEIKGLIILRKKNILKKLFLSGKT